MCPLIPALQNREYNGWVEELHLRVKKAYVDGLPLLAGSKSRVFKIYDLNEKDFLRDPEVMRNFGRDGYIYVFQNYDDKGSIPSDPRNRQQTIQRLGHARRPLQVHLMNELNHHANKDADNQLPGGQRFTHVERIVDIALNPKLGVALNMLDIRTDSGPSVHSPSPWCDRPINSFYATTDTPFCSSEAPFPSCLISWLLYSTGNTMHPFHVDSNGLCTHVVTNGPKVWIAAGDQDSAVDGSLDPTDFLGRLSSQSFENVYPDPTMGRETWHLEAYVQHPKDLLYVGVSFLGLRDI
jgi:hypothetical protein